MQELLTELDQIVDLSPEETRLILQSFKQFLDRRLEISPEVMNDIFTHPVHLLLNQQEDEDNFHAMLTETFTY
ncbi:MAG: hypothetical protein QM725_10640 [Lacibacter sp.]